MSEGHPEQCQRGQSDKISHIDIQDDSIDTVISRIPYRYPISISHIPIIYFYSVCEALGTGTDTELLTSPVYIKQFDINVAERYQVRANNSEAKIISPIAAPCCPQTFWHPFIMCLRGKCVCAYASPSV